MKFQTYLFKRQYVLHFYNNTMIVGEEQNGTVTKCLSI